MLKIHLPLALLAGLSLPSTPILAMEPQAVVIGIYAEHPWTTLPPGGHQGWAPDIAAAWEHGNSGAGLLFLAGPGEGRRTVTAERIAPGAHEARVRAVVWGSDGKAQGFTFIMIGDDDEDDRWRVHDVVTDEGDRLSSVLAQR